MNKLGRGAAGLALLLASAWLPLPAADSEPQWIVLNRAARQAIEAKDYPKVRETLAALQPLLPGNPRILYNLAAADAHLGHAEQALTELTDLAGSGLIYDFSADGDFASLRESPRFAAVLHQVELNRNPIAHASFVSALPERDLLPEDLAYDAKTHRFLVASVTMCKIVTSDGKLFAKSDWPVMALRVDARRRILWAATGWIDNCRQCNPADKGKTALLAFNLDSGARIKRVDSPVEGLLGDMTIGRAGDLFVSEGYHGAVLHLKVNASALERLDTPGEFRSPQTPALSADERTLYVPDYVRGIAAIDLKTRAVRWLQPGNDIIVTGIDGFYRYGNGFLAIQNGVKPERLVLFSPDLKKQQVLEANTPGLGEPSHGMFLGDTFYFLANTGWDAYDDNGKKKPETAPVESQLRKIECGHGGCSRY
jgi:hypothetical protein